MVCKYALIFPAFLAVVIHFIVMHPMVRQFASDIREKVKRLWGKSNDSDRRKETRGE